jgi:hypothetical protein
MEERLLGRIHYDCSKAAPVSLPRNDRDNLKLDQIGGWGQRRNGLSSSAGSTPERTKALVAIGMAHTDALDLAQHAVVERKELVGVKAENLPPRRRAGRRSAASPVTKRGWPDSPAVTGPELKHRTRVRPVGGNVGGNYQLARVVVLV